MNSLECLIEGAHHPCQHSIKPSQRALSTNHSEGPQLSLKSTPGSLVHSFGSLQVVGCGKSVSFQAALGIPYLLHPSSLLVSGSKGQQLQLKFPVVRSSSASTVLQAQQKYFPQLDLKIAFHSWLTKFVQFLHLETFYWEKA